MTKYVLVICSPDLQEKRFESQTPFMSIAQGDVLNMTLFRDTDGLNMPLRVASVEHMVWQDGSTGQVIQTITIYTERYSLD